MASLSTDTARKPRARTHKAHKTEWPDQSARLAITITWRVNYLMRTTDRSACRPWSADFSRTRWLKPFADADLRDQNHSYSTVA